MNKELDRRQLAIRWYCSQSKDSFENRLLDKLKELRVRPGDDINDDERFTYFWKSSSPFSQWHPVEFIGGGIIWDDKSFLGELPLEITFSSALQYMMYHKAMLFLDRNIAKKILNSREPREQKRLGKKVANFDEHTWKYYRASIVYWGNEKKFSQNPEFLSLLQSTRGTTLVEASPYDKIWGTGLLGSDPISEAGGPGKVKIY